LITWFTIDTTGTADAIAGVLDVARRPVIQRPRLLAPIALAGRDLVGQLLDARCHRRFRACAYPIEVGDLAIAAQGGKVKGGLAPRIVDGALAAPSA
jgi:hypothetical protein